MSALLDVGNIRNHLESSFIHTIIRRLSKCQLSSYKSQYARGCHVYSETVDDDRLTLNIQDSRDLKGSTWNRELGLRRVALLPQSLDLARCLPFGDSTFIVKRITTPSFLVCCPAQTVSTLLL
jgi:hypothetical protein